MTVLGELHCVCCVALRPEYFMCITANDWLSTKYSTAHNIYMNRERTPSKRMVVDSNPTRGSFFFEKYLPWASCVVLLCLSVVLCCFVFLSKHLIDDLSHVHL